MAWGIAETATDKEKLKAEFNDYISGLNSCGVIDYVTYNKLFDMGMELLDRMYALVPARHGHWIAETNPKDNIWGHAKFKCSACGEGLWLRPMELCREKYCSNCSAKMDEENNDERDG